MIEGDLTMNKLRFTLKAFAFVVFALACASAAQAQATRTWVSGVGDDVNPCSRTAPCKTFAGAISKTADGGEIDCLDPGGFGTVTITKSMTIDGTKGAGFGSILAAGTTGVNVNDSLSGAPMTKIVRLRNLSINGATTGINGINYTSAKALYVEDCVIFGFKGGAGNTQGNGIRVSLTADGGQLLVRDTIIDDNRTDGIQTTTTSGTLRVDLDRVRSDRNLLGIHTINNTVINISNSSASNNTGQGAQFENSTTANIDHSQFDNNLGNGIFAGNGASTVRLSDCSIVNNPTAGINISGGTVFTYGDNKIRGNGPAGVTDVTGGVLNGSTTKQ
jgi:hypothetical protein